MSKKKYIVQRKDKDLEAFEIGECINRMDLQGLELVSRMEVKRFGKVYIKMIFQRPQEGGEL
jgi:hypothetical protein